MRVCRLKELWVSASEHMQVSATTQVHPNALHSICEELSRDVVMKYGYR